MNKQELIDKAVHTLKGVLPSCDTGEFIEMHDYICRKAQDGSFYPQSVCSTPAFQQRAKELGYINGYRWGVEYPTNGKKPDLPSDVKCSVKFIGNIAFSLASRSINNWPFDQTSHFKITDERYKPADTSYLDSVSEATESKSSTESVSEIADLSVAISSAANLAVDLGFVKLGRQLLDLSKEALAEANKRKAEAEKKRVVEAAWHGLSGDMNYNDTINILTQLYDAGYLRTPSN